MTSNRTFFMMSLFVLASVSARADEPPFRGIVMDPVQKPFSLRSAPPIANSTSYQLGYFACAVYPGATVFVTDQRQIANGEIWDFIQVDRPSNLARPRPTECSAGATGWMIGQLKSGAPVIAVLQASLRPPSGTAVVPQRQIASIETADRAKRESFISLYVFLAVGTFLGTVVAAWERHGSISRIIFRSPLTIVEMLLLVVASVIAMIRFVPRYFAVDASSVNARMFQQMTQSHDGHFIIGFVFAVIAMRALSYGSSGSRSNGSSSA